MRNTLGAEHFIAILAALSIASVPAVAQRDSADWVRECREWDDDRRGRHCEVREQTIRAGGTISVDGHQNGGISVEGWDRNEVLVRAKIQTSGESDADAQALAREVRIETASGNIRADGPRTRGRTHWSVSFELFVPRRSDLSLETVNGGIRLKDVHGRMELSATNGGIALDDVAGDVRGHTTNGGLRVNLNGKRWEGEGLDLSTTNGGIKLSLPNNYSANLETGTTNGGIEIDFPITVQGRLGRRLTTKLGDGGPTIRLITTNGGVVIRRGRDG